MPKSVVRTYSSYTRQALTLLGGLIHAARLERKLSAQELSDRAGISRSMLQRIEKADAKCEIGAVFEVAAIVGVPLFEAEERALSERVRGNQSKLALLPKRVRKPKKVKDDF